VADSIVADMVSRYGDAVLTKPPRTITAVALVAGAALFVTVIIGLALRPPRGGAPAPAPPTGRGPPTDDDRQLEDRLADELSALD
jgi:cytochrome c-type biogenesis protein CcmH/NrfF